MKILKKYLFTLLLPILLVCSLSQQSYAQTTYDWAGTTNTKWETAANWRVGGVVPATCPGLTASDIVRIGVSTSIATFGNQPSIGSVTAATYTIASLTFGNNNAAVGAQGNLSLTIGSGSTLTVTGTVLQMHSATGGAANSGGLSEATMGSTDAIYTNINGPGTLHCHDFTVGDNTVPSNAYVNNRTYVNLRSAITITVDNNFTINSATSHQDGDQSVITRNSDPFVSFQSGTLTITNQLVLTNINPYWWYLEAYIPSTSFSIDQTTANATLNFGGVDPLNITISLDPYVLNYVDFYNVPFSGSGQSTVTFLRAGDQKVYNSNSYPTYALDQFPKMYQNIAFGGSGTKTFDIGTTTLAGNLTLNAGSELVDLSVNTSSVSLPGALSVGAGTTLQGGAGDISVTGAVTNAGTITLGSGSFTMTNNFTNSGTLNSGSSTVIFNGTGPVTLNDSAPGGTIFNNVNFTSGYNATIQSGTFGVSGTGVMTLSNSGTTVVAGTNNFIFKSDASGTATLAALPSGCQLSGTNITVQRYIPGGSSTSRGYRLLSSAVNAGSDSYGNKIYSINYLLNSTYISGTGFPTGSNSKTGNPSLYLFRENLAPLYTTFLNSNYIGIANYSASPSYGMNDTTYPTTNIPVGNGYLFYFRGGPTTVNPFVSGSLAQSAVLASTGTLNQGNIIFSDWYSPSTTNVGYTAASANASIEGMNLAGNPYPSTIDWNTWSSTNSNAGIYGPGLSGEISLLNPGSQAGAGNYTYYIPGVGSNMSGYTGLIPSGVGFFVQAASAGATLTFTENAKVTSQPSGAGLFLANKQILAAVKQQLRLQMQLDSINLDATLINFNANTKPAYSINEDARYRAGSGKVSLASLSSDNIPLAINQLPLALKGDTIPLKVGATASGTYTLKMESVTGIPQIYDIWLKDAFTKDSVNLRKTSTYSFTVNMGDTTTFGAHRFVLTLQENPALAYKLISFDAEKGTGGRQVQVTWKTQNEEDYTQFTVERSNDNGKTYNVIGGMTSSGQGTYSITDRNPANGSNQYRLKQQDFNQNISYSNVINIDFAGIGNSNANRVSVYPNPAISNINLTIVPKSQGNTTYDITISNSSGKVVKLAHITDTNWQDNVSSLLMGTYLIQVTDRKNNNVIGQTKLVKL